MLLQLFEQVLELVPGGRQLFLADTDLLQLVQIVVGDRRAADKGRRAKAFSVDAIAVSQKFLTEGLEKLREPARLGRQQIPQRRDYAAMLELQRFRCLGHE